MRKYHQLTEEDCIEIYVMKQAGKEQNQIAVKLGVHPCTVSRELSCNPPGAAGRENIYGHMSAGNCQTCLAKV